MTDYTYQHSAFTNMLRKPCLPYLRKEIATDPLLLDATVETIINNETECVITYPIDLTAPQIAALDAVIAAHEGLA